MTEKPTQNDTDLVENSFELIFLYDTVYTNPSGDPSTEQNRPRRDDITDKSLVTPVRLKRVVREYIERLGETIFIKQADTDGDQHDKGDRYEALKEAEVDELVANGYGEREGFLEAATDTRIFGDSMASDAFNFDPAPITGPVQFDMTQSMNETENVAIGQTSVIRADSSDGGRGGNMYTDYRVPYALFRTHGVIDAMRAKDSLMKPADIDLLIDGLWEGTRVVNNTSSKRGHEPRLLIQVEYTDDLFIGDLHNDVSLDLAEDVLAEKEMRDISDGYVNVTELLSVLDRYNDRIKQVSVKVHRRTQFTVGDEHGDVSLFEQGLQDAVGDEKITLKHD